MTQLPSADSLLDSSPVAKFEEIGDIITGTLVEDPEATQQSDFDTGEPAFWRDGQPKMQLVIRLVDAAGEETRLYAKAGSLSAIKKALAKADAPLRKGGELWLKFSGEGEPPRKGYHPPKLFEAAYDPPKDVSSPASSEPPF